MNKRRTPYRKNVEKDVLEALPEPAEGQHIVQVVQAHGSNIFEVAFPPPSLSTPSRDDTTTTTMTTEATEATTTAEAKTTTATTTAAAAAAPANNTLARLPTRFRKLIWVKRGTYLLCSSSDADYQTSNGKKGKVTMNVEYVLFERQVKHLQKRNMWPDAWSDAFNGVTEYSREEMLAAAEEEEEKKNRVKAAAKAEEENERKVSESGGVVGGEEVGEKVVGGEEVGEEEVGEEEEEDNDDDLFVNRNRSMRRQDDSDTDFSDDD